MQRGQFAHDSIHDAPPALEEKRLGLVVHYGIGIAFAGLLLVCRPGWTDRPTLAPAMATRTALAAGATHRGGAAAAADYWAPVQPGRGEGRHKRFGSFESCALTS